jgi:hypothetical protein
LSRSNFGEYEKSLREREREGGKEGGAKKILGVIENKPINFRAVTK